jgi:RNA polymerase sigma-70 factor (ECF subfamily)
MLGMGAGCRGSRLIPVEASGSPAFAQYRAKPDGTGHFAWGLVVLELEGNEVAGVNTFLDTATLFPAFGLPLELPA